jgi:hypothetical protein
MLLASNFFFYFYFLSPMAEQAAMRDVVRYVKGRAGTASTGGPIAEQAAMRDVQRYVKGRADDRDR